MTCKDFPKTLPLTLTNEVVQGYQFTTFSPPVPDTKVTTKKTNASNEQVAGDHYKKCSIQPWADIPFFEEQYECSRTGEIRSKVRVIKRPHPKNPERYQFKEYGGGIKAQKRNRNGYLEVTLWKDNCQYTRSVHSLVAQTFLGVYEGLEVNHKDGNKTNNHVDNLEWVTRQQNIADREARKNK